MTMWPFVISGSAWLVDGLVAVSKSTKSFDGLFVNGVDASVMGVVTVIVLRCANNI